MARNLLTATFDAATELKDAGAITSTAAAQVGGVNRVVNVGNALIDAVVNIDVDALDITTGDESYDIRIQGSTSATFASDVHNLVIHKAGDSSVTGETVDSVVGRRSYGLINSGDGSTPLPYIRAYLTIAGTTPSINCRIWMTKDPR